MIDKGKVIQGLECCARSKFFDKCDECSYFSDCLGEAGTCARIASEALELIKAQEPRLIVKEDFDNHQLVDEYGYMPVWREEKETRELVCECVLIGCLDPEPEDYKWPYRYWTAKPSKELMEATPWN